MTDFAVVVVLTVVAAMTWGLLVLSDRLLGGKQ
jgi:hypothetical protein